MKESEVRQVIETCENQRLKFNAVDPFYLPILIGIARDYADELERKRCAKKDTRHKPYYEYADGCPAEAPGCSEYHKLNQDKDDLCPCCGKCLNDDF